MKKILISFLILGFLLCPILVFSKEIPAPFAKAKELALSVQPNEKQQYIWKVSFNENGGKVEYWIAYMKTENHEFISLIKIRTEFVLVVNHCITHNTFSVFGSQFGWMEIDREMAVKASFEYFRELVSQNLL